MVWETNNIQGISTTFGISGLIYNSNHILYDKSTKSYWLQMYSKCVAGDFEALLLNCNQVVETTWANWKAMFPSARVLSTQTGYNYDYSIDPYPGYAISDTIEFYTQPIDRRLPLKERIHALIVGDRARVYRYNSFPDGITVIQENFQGVDLVIAGSQSRNFIVSFERKLPSGPLLDFSPDSEAANIILIDNEGTRWDIFGTGVDGPRKGQQLTPTYSMIGYWFAIGAMYPDALIY
jgi:hypothetical protein